MPSKFIRTIVKIFDIDKLTPEDVKWLTSGYHKIGDTVEELCDEFVAVDITLYGDKIKVYKTVKDAREDKFFLYDRLYGAIWTDKGLIYVAKMNSQGEWELCQG